MDSSHVALVSLLLRQDGFQVCLLSSLDDISVFQHFRADRTVTLGVNMSAMAKILKCADNKDVLTLRADDNGDSLVFLFEDPKQNRVSQFSLRLMEIDAEHLGIPETDYCCIVRMPSSEFKRVCSEIGVIGDTIKITVSKEGIKFSVTGDTGSGSIVCKPSLAIDNDDDQISIIAQQEVPFFLIHGIFLV